MSEANVQTERKKRWPREEALRAAEDVVARLGPVCERLQVAGSLRRGRAEVGDVEFVYIPMSEERPADLFEAKTVNLADEEIERMLAEGILAKREAKNGRTSWGSLNKLAVHASGVPVDLFATTEGRWWNTIVCRTGPAESNARIATAAKRRGYTWNPYGEGFTDRATDRIVRMESEEQVFAFAGLPYRPPEER